ncbi:MAG: putative spheroidene monooxygenase, partial [Acidimicrobiales bacterium]|nr:putative spheroidene monooxygenase [Acidimicrobiales bacterium]
WTVRLAPLGARGSWGGHQPLPDERATTDGPVAVLTRARLRVRSWPAFYRAVPPVEAALHAAPGVLAVVGVGEAPVGLQATFSLWRSAADMEAFAAAPGPHRDVARRARAEGWFAEDLFARFRPYASTGTWGGRDPLAGAGGNGSVDTAAARRRSSAGTTGNSIP